MKLQASDEVLKKIAAYSSGDARSAYNVLEVAASLAADTTTKNGRGNLRRTGSGRPAEARPALRQAGRRALQPHLGAAQIGAQQRSRRGALLAGTHARSRRRSAVHRPPGGANGGGGYRPGRSQRAFAVHGGPRCRGFSRHAGRQPRAGASRGVSCRWRPSRMRCTPPMARFSATWSEPLPNRSRSTCATRPRD